MRRKSLWFALLLAGLFALAGWTQRAASVQWEYRVIEVRGEAGEVEQMLNKLGAQGWELIAARPLMFNGGTTNTSTYYMKRSR